MNKTSGQHIFILILSLVLSAPAFGIGEIDRNSFKLPEVDFNSFIIPEEVLFPTKPDEFGASEENGVLCLRGRPDSEYLRVESKLTNCNETGSGFENFSDERICGCLYKNYAITRGSIPDPFALTPLDAESNKLPDREEFDDFDRRYFEEVGSTLMNQFNSTIEKLGVISMMTTDQSDLAKVSSCRVNSIIDSMKTAISQCDDKKSAEKVFNMMFAGNTEKHFTLALDKYNPPKYDEVLAALDGELKANLSIWSSESTPIRYPNACVPLKNFAYMQMMRTDVNNTPYKDEYQDLLREYRVNKSSGKTNSEITAYNSDLSSPIMEIIVEDEAFMDSLLDAAPISDEYHNMNRNFRGYSMTHMPERVLRSEANLFTMIQKDPSIKYQILQKLLDKTNETCKALTNPDDYKDILCKTPNYRPSAKLLIESTPSTTWTITADDIYSKKYDEFTSKLDLFERSCKGLPKDKNDRQAINNNYTDNKLLNLLSKTSQPISYMDNFKSSEPHSDLIDMAKSLNKNDNNSLVRNQMLAKFVLPDDVPLSNEVKDTRSENSLGKDYEDFNSFACNGKSQIENSNLAINNMLEGLDKELLDKIKSSIPLPSADGAIKAGEMDAYFAKVKDTIIKAYEDEFGELYDEGKVAVELNGITSESGEFSIGLTRWLKEVKGIDFEEMEKTLNPHAIEDLGLLAQIKEMNERENTEERVPIIDYAYNGTDQDQQSIDATTEPIVSSITDPNNLGLSARNTRYTPSDPSAPVRQSFVYTPKGLPQSPPGESFLSVKSLEVEPPSNPIVESPIIVADTPVVETETIPESEEVETDDPINNDRPKRDSPTEVVQNLDLNGPGLTLSTSSSSPVIDANGSTIAANSNTDSLERSDLSNGLNDNSNNAAATDNTTTGKSDKLMDELRAMRDKLKGSNSDLASRINNLRSAGTSGGSSRNSGRSPSSVTSAPKNYSFNGPSRPSRNAFNQFSGQTVSSADDSKNRALAERVKAAKKEGNFTDKPSAFPGGAGSSGAGGSSRSPATVSGGPSGSGVIAGAGGNIFIPSGGDNGETGGSEYVDPLSELIEGLFEDDRPHVLSKVIPHALILNNENGAQGLIEILGLQGRRFTTLDVYYLTPGGKPSYNVSIYDYDIGDNDTLNNVKFRKRLIKTINTLKKDNAETDQYMKQFYGDSKYSQPEEILGSISAKLKLMYKRPGCANPDYDPVGGGPCIHSDEIEKLKNRLLTQEEMIELIEYDSSLKMSE